jgi:hypothetical protein
MEVFIYSIRWYCDSYDGNMGKTITNSGIVAAENMGNAVKKLTTEAYENVEWVKIFAVEMGDCGYADINAINAVVMEEALISEE